VKDVKAANYLRRIAVDLTPVLPGGENGGAKIFILALLKRLAVRAPDTEFVLLTRYASHGELAVLDSPNMRRLLAVGGDGSSRLRHLARLSARRIISRMPAPLHAHASKLACRLNLAMKRRGTHTLMGEIGADLLFCPFTAPTFHTPDVATVCTIYDLQYRQHPEFFFPEEVAHRDFAFSEACAKADALVAISAFSRDEAIAYGDLPPSRISTVYLRTAKRLEQTRAIDPSIHDRLGLAPSRYLLYPANFWPHKNHELLIRAFQMACRDGLAGDIKLVCTGAPGARCDAVSALASRSGLGGRIHFPGYLSDLELSGLLQGAAGLIFPSLYEGFGMPVIEAMAAGIPVACSNAASLPEVAGDAALLFDPHAPAEVAAAIATLVHDQTRRQGLIAAGARRAVQFADVDRMAMEYWEIFSNCHATCREQHAV
jgi:glycosyltransferase involved in cell wall biosynthesis